MLTEKVCCSCKSSKPVSEFYKNKLTKDGLYRRCKSCHATSVRSWQEKNWGRHVENCKAWQEGNPDRQRENLRNWRATNPSQASITQKLWRAKNSVSIYARNAKRTEALKRATPEWADRKSIAKFYSDAERLTKETGVTWHVDHVIPLRSKFVSGLHVPDNLQVITATENVRKGNTFAVA